MVNKKDSMNEVEKKIDSILAYYESDGSNITYDKTMADILSLIQEERQGAERRGWKMGRASIELSPQEYTKQLEKFQASQFLTDGGKHE